MSKKNGKNGGLGASPHAENGQESGEVEIVVNSTQKKEPFGTPFQKGQSGNPGGRPKTSDLKAEVRSFADEEDPKIRKTRLRQWLEMADRRARQGSPKHLEMLLAYGWGRPSQAIEVEGNFSFTDALNSMRAKREQGFAALPAGTPGNGHSDAVTAQAAASLPDQDLTAAREDDSPAQPSAERPAAKIRVEL